MLCMRRLFSCNSFVFRINDLHMFAVYNAGLGVGCYRIIGTGNTRNFLSMRQKTPVIRRETKRTKRVFDRETATRNKLDLILKLLFATPDRLCWVSGRRPQNQTHSCVYISNNFCWLAANFHVIAIRNCITISTPHQHHYQRHLPMSEVIVHRERDYATKTALLC